MNLKTPLYDLHLDMGARMVDFAGYQMPLQYPEGIKKEHLHCRAAVGLFDVSHMGQLMLRGVDVISQLERLVPVDIGALADGQQTYALLTNSEGGIRDDLIITRWDQECIFMVVNAACKQEDIEYIRQSLSDSIEIEVLEQRALISLQGPKARDVMQDLCPQAARLIFMHGCRAVLLGEDCYITRCGYTGEDGFEISIGQEKAAELARALLDYEEVKAIGLGARDSLRLEAGLCLYGHDMDQHTSPVEAGLLWSISKSRRAGGKKAAGFPAADIILRQIEQGCDRRRIGLRIDGRAPVREGADLQDMEGNSVGRVTSGAATPSLEQPIAMAYVLIDSAAIGTSLQAVVRGRSLSATIVKMPFVPQHYYRG